MTNGSILVVDDERLIGEFIAEALGSQHQVKLAGTAASGLAALESGRFDLALVDLRLPDASGLDILRRSRESSPGTAVVVMTAHGSVETAVEAMRLGAVDFVEKPFDADTLSRVVDRSLEISRLRTENENLRMQLGDRYDLSRIVGKNPRILELLETVRTVAPTRATVLILGESGTGKELVARALHFLSDRSRGPLVKMNCAAVPESLLESELFGHERGAFTNAYRQTAGRFELAHGGTLLLDEVSEISPGMQAKLLRVLQEREFERVGGQKPLKVDVRIVATTNKDLEEAMNRGQFRRDLYYRLNVIPVWMPPLRERPDDIPLLAGHFAAKHSRDEGARPRRITAEAMAMLMTHPWPGNVRELENVIERALVMAPGDEIRPDHLGLGRDSRASGPVALAAGMTLRDAERRLILETLRAHRGNRTRASLVLGISVRTMRNKLNEYRRMGLFKEEAAQAGAEGRKIQGAAGAAWRTPAEAPADLPDALVGSAA